MNVDTPLLQSTESPSEEGATADHVLVTVSEKRDNFFYLSILYVIIYLAIGSFAYLWIFPLKNNDGVNRERLLLDHVYSITRVS